MAAGKMRNAKLAFKLHVKKASINKKPRHADNALVAISHIFIEEHERKAKFFPIEQLHATIRSLHEQTGDAEQLGKYCERNLNSHLLKTMAKHNYIRFDDTKSHVRVTRVAGKMMIEIADKIKTLHFPNALQRHRAHCDYFRQKLGTISSLTNKELNQRVDELECEITAHHQVCPLNSLGSTGPQSREARFASVGSFNVAGLGNEDVSLTDPPPATPARRQNPSNPEDAYRTPVSLLRRRSQTQIASPPPSPMRSHTSFIYNYGANDDMDVDDGPIAGPSMSSTSAHHLPSSSAELAAHRAHFATVAGTLGLQNPTFQSVEDTLRERLDKSATKDELIKDLKNENMQQRESYEGKLAEQDTHMTILECIHGEEMQDIMNERDDYSQAAAMSAQEAATLRQDLQDDASVTALLLSEHFAELHAVRQDLQKELSKSKKLAEDLSQHLGKHAREVYGKDDIIRRLAAQVADFNEQVVSMQKQHDTYAQTSNDNRSQMERDLESAKLTIQGLEKKQDELAQYIKEEQEKRAKERRERSEDEAKRTNDVLRQLLS